MDLDLDGRVAVVTGASKGIGHAIVQTLVDEGAYVIAAARNIDSLEGIEGVTAVAADLLQPDTVEDLVARAIAEHGFLDILVNNVGGAPLHTDGFLAMSDADFERAFALNFYVALRATRAALSCMGTRGGGSIVNVASVNAFYEPDTKVIDYGAAKAALVNVSKGLAQEFASQGIRINSVSPGPVSTDLWLGPDGVAARIAKAGGSDLDSVHAQAAAGLPTGRFTSPEEVATLVAVLASERTANVTGAQYVIDGGLITTT
jgi:NAD(P)-dependent dehydrogenase (short-subunit alcohol dehydrogenase family)